MESGSANNAIKVRKDLQSHVDDNRASSYERLQSLHRTHPASHSTYSTSAMNVPLPDGISNSEEQSASRSSLLVESIRDLSPNDRDSRDWHEPQRTRHGEQEPMRRGRTGSVSRYGTAPSNSLGSGIQRRKDQQHAIRGDTAPWVFGEFGEHVPLQHTSKSSMPYKANNVVQSAHAQSDRLAQDNQDRFTHTLPNHYSQRKQPSQSVSIPYSLRESKSKTGIKDFSSYSFGTQYGGYEDQAQGHDPFSRYPAEMIGALPADYNGIPHGAIPVPPFLQDPAEMAGALPAYQNSFSPGASVPPFPGYGAEMAGALPGDYVQIPPGAVPAPRFPEYSGGMSGALPADYNHIPPGAIPVPAFQYPIPAPLPPRPSHERPFQPQAGFVPPAYPQDFDPFDDEQSDDQAAYDHFRFSAGVYPEAFHESRVGAEHLDASFFHANHPNVIGMRRSQSMPAVALTRREPDLKRSRSTPALCQMQHMQPRSARTSFSLNNSLYGADEIPLPPSVSSGSAEHGVRKRGTSSSPLPGLRAQDQITFELERGFEDLLNPPSSKPKKSGGPFKKGIRSKSSYIERLVTKGLIACMPHLKIIQNFARRPERSPLITRLDYKHNIDDPRQSSRRTFSSEDWVGLGSEAFAKKLSKGGTHSAFLRVLFVEDLTLDLINSLGSLYSIDPELFASHLSGGGTNTLAYGDPPAARWSTAKMQKSYFSLKWYRPVRLNTKVSPWLRDPQKLAKLGQDGIQWSEVKLERHGKAIHKTEVRHSVTLDNNIFRRSWPLSTHPPDVAGRDGMRHSVWEEKASVFMSENKGLTTMIVLLDPLPVLVDDQTIQETVYTNRLALPLARRSTVTRRAKLTFDAFSPISARRPMRFPANMLKASDEDVHVLHNVTETACSTRTDIESWIRQFRRSKNGPRSGTADPLVAVLRLAIIDSMEYLNNLGWTLDDITRDSLNETIMIKYLPAWRRLLSDLEIELPTLGREMRLLIEPTHAAFADFDPMLADLDSRINDILARVHNVYAVLRSEMALLDSSRSIAEARTVAKLTELAFAFVPLTFACSLFSMQVTELQNGVPFWAFVITAIGLGLFTYVIRLILQSNTLGLMRRTLENKMSASGEHEAGSRITLSQLLKYLSGELWQHKRPVLTVLVFFTALSIPVLPIAFLWTRNHLDVGLNAMLTVLTLPLGVISAWYAQSAFREITWSANDTESENSISPLSIPERLALRIAPFWSRRRDSADDSTTSEA